MFWINIESELVRNFSKISPKYPQFLFSCIGAPMMPMMLAPEASIIDIIWVPFLLPKPSGAVLVFEAMLAGAPHEACVQNGTCKGAHDALTEGGLHAPQVRGGLGRNGGPMMRGRRRWRPLAASQQAISGSEPWRATRRGALRCLI